MHSNTARALSPRFPRLAILCALTGLCLALVPVTVGAQSTPPELYFRSFGVDPDLREMFPGETVAPPYRIELWVASAHGLPGKGTKDIIEDYLRQDLRGLGDVEVVQFLSGEPKSALRLRVWFSELEKPDPYDCFNITIAVVVGKISGQNRLAETVIDCYALAGVTERDLMALSQQIATRLDVKILAGLRKMSKESR